MCSILILAFNSSHMIVLPFLSCQLESVRLWSNGNFKAMNSFLMTVDWDGKFEGKSARDCYRVFLALTLDLVDQFVPWKVFNSNEKPKWMATPPRSLMCETASSWKE